MLELDNIGFAINNKGEVVDLLKGITLSVKQQHFMAIVGPSGCGKTTLLKNIAGINQETEGNIYWNGRNLADDEDLEPNEVGYVPQFSIAYDHLSVEENIINAIKLRVKTDSSTQINKVCDQVLAQTGMENIRTNLVKVLSGGQKRRLGLALELVSSPTLLLCDEVTSGLDPKSETEIVHLLSDLAKNSDRLVISVTHSLSNLDLYDSVLVLYQGKLAYHGPPDTLEHYFHTENAEEIYPQLALRTPEEWHNSWLKHKKYYYKKINEKQKVKSKTSEETADESKKSEPSKKPVSELPSVFDQFFTLLFRRFKIFFRDKTHLILHLAILFGFPLLVIIFALNGIPELPLSPNPSDFPNPLEYGERKAIFSQDQAEIGSIISGLVMFQVVLLTLMASNNSAREIAAERNIFEKEKFSGVSPLAYIFSKVTFLSVLVIVQSVLMGIIVKPITNLPGPIVPQFLLLIMVNFAMTMLCLGISALMRSPEQASLLSVYLVGFQLPLSGAVLALPKFLSIPIPPMISAYWGWSGHLDSMRASGGNFYDAVKAVTETKIETVPICLMLLAAHAIIGLVVAYVGVNQHRWEQ